MGATGTVRCQSSALNDSGHTLIVRLSDSLGNFHPRPRISQLRVRPVTPNLTLADERQRLLRMWRFKFPCQTMAVKYRVQRVSRGVAIADPVDRLNLIRRPLSPSPVKFSIQLGVRNA